MPLVILAVLVVGFAFWKASTGPKLPAAPGPSPSGIGAEHAELNTPQAQKVFDVVLRAMKPDDAANNGPNRIKASLLFLMSHGVYAVPPVDPAPANMSDVLGEALRHDQWFTLLAHCAGVKFYAPSGWH
jgi:hypothetical protein